MSLRNYIHTMLIGDMPDTGHPRGLHITTLVIILAWTSCLCVILLLSQGFLVKQKDLANTYSALLAKKIYHTQHVYGFTDIEIEHNATLDMASMDIARMLPALPDKVSYSEENPSSGTTITIVGSSLFISPTHFIRKSLELEKVRELLGDRESLGTLHVGASHMQYPDSVWGVSRQGIVVTLYKEPLPYTKTYLKGTESTLIQRYDDLQKVSLGNRILFIIPIIVFILMIVTATIGLVLCTGALLYGFHYRRFVYILQALLIIAVAVCVILVIAQGITPEIVVLVS